MLAIIMMHNEQSRIKSYHNYNEYPGISWIKTLVKVKVKDKHVNQGKTRGSCCGLHLS